MNTELVSTENREGILLSGAYFAGESENATGVVLFHGDGGNFYSPLYLTLANQLSRNGFACVSANRRGHDLISHGKRGGAFAGYAFESVSDAVSDYRAWVDWMKGRGHRGIVLAGHSGGGVRAVYAKSNADFEDVQAVVSVSPGEYRHEGVLDCHGERFRLPFERAKRALIDGDPGRLETPGVPWGSMWSAKAFVDCFNEDDRYSVSANAQNTHCPTLFVFGEDECDGPQTLPVCALAHRDVLGAAYPHVDVRLLPSANHGYQGQELALGKTICDWLAALA